MSRDIDDLIEPFRTSIKELIKKANDAGIPAFVTDTTRTIEEQRELVRKGLSKTLDSKHLIGEAADIAFEVDGELSYDRKLYKRLYAITKDISFVVWPYKDHWWNWDWPHHQYDKNKKPDTLTDMDELLAEVKGHKETLEKLVSCEIDREDLREKIRNMVPKSVYEKMERVKNTEIGRVTTQRDKCLRGENSKLAAIWQIITG